MNIYKDDFEDIDMSKSSINYTDDFEIEEACILTKTKVFTHFKNGIFKTNSSSLKRDSFVQHDMSIDQETQLDIEMATKSVQVPHLIKTRIDEKYSDHGRSFSSLALVLDNLLSIQPILKVNTIENEFIIQDLFKRKIVKETVLFDPVVLGRCFSYATYTIYRSTTEVYKCKHKISTIFPIWSNSNLYFYIVTTSMILEIVKFNSFQQSELVIQHHLPSIVNKIEKSKNKLYFLFIDGYFICDHTEIVDVHLKFNMIESDKYISDSCLLLDSIATASKHTLQYTLKTRLITDKVVNELPIAKVFSSHPNIYIQTIFGDVYASKQLVCSKAIIIAITTWNNFFVVVFEQSITCFDKLTDFKYEIPFEFKITFAQFMQTSHNCTIIIAQKDKAFVQFYKVVINKDMLNDKRSK